MKSQDDILTIIYQVVKTSPINLLSGGIYKKYRPTNSTLEDCVISVIPGGNGKFLQDGALYVKLFFNDKFQNNTYVEDFLKGSQFEHLLFDLSEILLKNTEISFDIQSRETYIEKVEEIEQHYGILKINFKITQH